MAPPISLRLGEETQQKVARIARRKKVSPSALMRQAIEELVEREEAVCRPYDLMKDLIGIVDGGDPTRSTDIGKKFAKYLKTRRRSA
jgi:predicted DNA-binding protein